MRTTDEAGEEARCSLHAVSRAPQAWGAVFEAAASLLFVGRLDALALRLVRARGPRLSHARCAAEGRGPAGGAGAEALVGGAAAIAQERRRATAATLQQLDQLLVARVALLRYIQRCDPQRHCSSRICAGSEERGTAVTVTTDSCKVERCLTLVCPSVDLRGAHLLVIRAPDEHRDARKMPVLSGIVEAGERFVVVRCPRSPHSQEGLHHSVMTTLTRKVQRRGIVRTVRVTGRDF